MKAKRWVVVGGGINGIIAAHHLANRGRNVTLVEPAKALGGGMRSVPWKGFHLDRGCHLFSNESNESTDIILDILGRDHEPVAVNYASIFNGTKTEGFAIPNLGGIKSGTEKKILYELLHSAARTAPPSHHFQEELDNRFGITAGRIFSGMVKKMFQCKAEELSPDVLRFSPFRRIKLFDDMVGELLKDNPVLNDRVAVGSADDPMRFVRDKASRRTFKNFYPKKQGMSMFCDRAERRLQTMGVNLQMGRAVTGIELKPRSVKLSMADGSELTADAMYWSGGPVPLANSLGLEVESSKYLYGVPMVAHYFVIRKQQESSYTYVQNYDREDPWFRASIPGGYIKASPCPPGLSYVCCEVPTSKGSKIWQEGEAGAEKVWKSLAHYEIVRGNKPVETMTVNAPQTFVLPRRNHPELVDQISRQIGEHERIVWNRTPTFSKNEIINAVLRDLE